MRRKVVLIILALFLTGCARQPEEEGQRWMETVDSHYFSRFYYHVLRHRETGVCYLVTNRGTVPLLKPDGSLYVLEE